jgi:hypothetical protein
MMPVKAAVAVAILVSASPLFGQDLSGTWVLNAGKSRSNQPLPASRVLTIQRAPSGYVIHQVDGTDTTTFVISLGAAASVNLPDGASAVRYSAHTLADTIVYVEDVTVDNQGLASTQSGRLFLSDRGRVLTDVNELVGGAEPVEQQLVFDKRR